MNQLKIEHDAGFFSCCSVRLTKIIEFFRDNNFAPTSIDGSKLFRKYKTEDIDITSIFFKEPKSSEFKNCNFDFDTQFIKYKDIDFDAVLGFIDAYFSFSDQVNCIVKDFEEKYKLEYNNLCAVFYRGNDKCGETGLGSYDEFFEKADCIFKKDKEIKFLVQTDELEFLKDFGSKYSNTIFFSEIPLISNSNTSVHDTIQINERIKYAAYFLAATMIVSKCKYLITHSGNCGLWAVLYRRSTKNTYQYLNHKDFKGWIIG